jgi:hypothetical protein
MAGSGLALEHDNAQPALSCPPRGRQTDRAAADDGDVE